MGAETPKRHGSTLHVDLPPVPESTLRERALICLHALATSEGLTGCDGGASDEPCFFPRCLADGCDGEPAATTTSSSPTPEEPAPADVVPAARLRRGKR